jgi:hypothetical protein
MVDNTSSSPESRVVSIWTCMKLWVDYSYSLLCANVLILDAWILIGLQVGPHHFSDAIIKMFLGTLMQSLSLNTADCPVNLSMPFLKHSYTLYWSHSHL